MGDAWDENGSCQIIGQCLDFVTTLTIPGPTLAWNPQEKQVINQLTSQLQTSLWPFKLIVFFDTIEVMGA